MERIKWTKTWSLAVATIKKAQNPHKDRKVFPCMAQKDAAAATFSCCFRYPLSGGCRKHYKTKQLPGAGIKKTPNPGRNASACATLGSRGQDWYLPEVLKYHLYYRQHPWKSLSAESLISSQLLLCAADIFGVCTPRKLQLYSQMSLDDILTTENVSGKGQPLPSLGGVVLNGAQLNDFSWMGAF